MQDIVLLYIDEYIENDIIFDNFDVVDYISDKLRTSGLNFEIVISAHSKYSGKYSSYKNFIKRTNCDIADWKKIFSSFNAGNIIKIFADSPFIDVKVISEMFEIHNKYLAEFTYSENLPQGFSCVIVSRELIDSIPDADEKMLPLENVVKSNISQFDVELYYKGPDIRDKRLNFRIADKREKTILENIFKIKNEIPAYENMKDVIEKNTEVLYVSPSYYEVEITTQSELTSIYSYRNIVEKNRSEMKIDVFKKLISEADEAGFKYTLCLGGSGDPLMHSSFYEIADSALKSELLERLIIETDGILCDETFISFLNKKNDKRIHVIVDCAGYDKGTYSQIHGSDFFDKLFSNISQLKEYFGEDSSRFYIQIMKINETEKFLDKYYDFWMKQKVSIILQKQNTYLGKIEDRRYYDLSPVLRTPCWHLQRDLYVISDGTAAFCKQDVNGEFSNGNISMLSVREIWSSKKNFFLNDYKKEYCKNPECEKCDEWYTFNF